MGVLNISEDGSTYTQIPIGDSLPVLDSTAVVKGSADATKLLKLEVDGNATGITGTLATSFSTAKTLTFPNATDTLICKATTDTLTNKTINGNNNTLTVLAASQLSGAAPIANGGTGQTAQQAAIDALTDVSSATNEHVLTKDTATGNAVFKAAAGGTPLPVTAKMFNPSAGDEFDLITTAGAITLVDITDEIKDGTNVVYNIEDRSRTDKYTAGTDIMSDATATTTGNTFAETNAVAANRCLVLTVTSVSGSVTEFSVSVGYTID